MNSKTHLLNSLNLQIVRADLFLYFFLLKSRRLDAYFECRSDSVILTEYGS
jgi:hypothetical protein